MSLESYFIWMLSSKSRIDLIKYELLHAKACERSFDYPRLGPPNPLMAMLLDRPFDIPSQKLVRLPKAKSIPLGLTS